MYIKISYQELTQKLFKHGVFFGSKLHNQIFKKKCLKHVLKNTIKMYIH